MPIVYNKFHICISTLKKLIVDFQLENFIHMKYEELDYLYVCTCLCKLKIIENKLLLRLMQ